MDRKSNEMILKELKKFISKANKKFPLTNAILFGSRARGDYLNSSDVDLILVSEKFENIPFRKRAIELFDLWEEDIDLEVLCYSPKEFEIMKKRYGIVMQAEKEGKVLI